jgi:large subunit ribosomal protein L4
MRRLALVSSLSEKVREDKLVVLESLVLDQPKTQEMAVTVNSLGVSNRVLLVADGADEAVIRTARNLEGVETTPARLLNASNLLKADTVIMTMAAVRAAEKLWGNVRHKRNRQFLPESQEENALS